MARTLFCVPGTMQLFHFSEKLASSGIRPRNAWGWDGVARMGEREAAVTRL